jgi:hypothetical protein
MKNNTLVITTTNWESFIASLKANIKQNYANCASVEWVNGHYRATLTQGTDKAYTARLDALTGLEKENTLDLLDSLCGNVRTIAVQEVKSEPVQQEPSVKIKTKRVRVA